MPAPAEYRRPELEVEVLDLLDAPAHREAGGDDGARRGPADQVEMVRQPESVAAAAAFAQQRLDPLEEGDGDDAARTAAIESKDLPFGRPDAGIRSDLPALFRVCHPLRASLGHRCCRTSSKCKASPRSAGVHAAEHRCPPPERESASIGTWRGIS